MRPIDGTVWLFSHLYVPCDHILKQCAGRRRTPPSARMALSTRLTSRVRRPPSAMPATQTLSAAPSLSRTAIDIQCAISARPAAQQPHNVGSSSRGRSASLGNCVYRCAFPFRLDLSATRNSLKLRGMHSKAVCYNRSAFRAMSPRSANAASPTATCSASSTSNGRRA